MCKLKHIRQLPMDVEAIMQTPLGNGRQDFWAWLNDQKGVFSVRSTYKMLVCTREKLEDGLEDRATVSSGPV
jgi:hypothetical protein